jgi:alpha-amylase
MPTLPSSTVNSLSITGSPPKVGATSQYSASVVLASTASVEDVTTVVTWQSADTTVLTVSKNGLVTGIKVGSTNLTATFNGSTVTAQVTIPSS